MGVDADARYDGQLRCDVPFVLHEEAYLVGVFLADGGIRHAVVGACLLVLGRDYIESCLAQPGKVPLHAGQQGMAAEDGGEGEGWGDGVLLCEVRTHEFYRRCRSVLVRMGWVFVGVHVVVQESVVGGLPFVVDISGGKVQFGVCTDGQGVRQVG